MHENVHGCTARVDINKSRRFKGQNPPVGLAVDGHPLAEGGRLGAGDGGQAGDSDGLHSDQLQAMGDKMDSHRTHDCEVKGLVGRAHAVAAKRRTKMVRVLMLRAC